MDVDNAQFHFSKLIRKNGLYAKKHVFSGMISTLTIVRYPKWLAWVGFLSMAIFRLALLFRTNISFWKLMGTGKNGSFDKIPDLRQWAILCTFKKMDAAQFSNLHTEILHHQLLIQLYGGFISGWYKFWHCEVWTVVLEPIEGHGKWDGKEPFGNPPKNTDHEGRIAILTRATIRIKKLKSFWNNVPAVANRLNDSKGFLGSFGIGEIPWIKQATFSIWESKTAMRDFAYKMQEHATVIQKTKKEDWYSEEMFVRFKPISSFGSLKGIDPLKMS